MNEKEESNNELTESKIQKKSEKDRNGIIGGILISVILLGLIYVVYKFFYEFSIGKVLVYILSFMTFICVAVSISCFFDYKESRKIENLEEDTNSQRH